MHELLPHTSAVLAAFNLTQRRAWLAWLKAASERGKVTGPGRLHRPLVTYEPRWPDGHVLQADCVVGEQYTQVEIDVDGRLRETHLDSIAI